VPIEYVLKGLDGEPTLLATTPMMLPPDTDAVATTGRCGGAIPAGGAVRVVSGTVAMGVLLRRSA